MNGNRYYGKVCIKHPDQEGLRKTSTGQCVECGKDALRAWRAKNKEQMKVIAKTLRQSKKVIVAEHYGGRCEMCGIDDPEVMTVDHIWDDGAKHREEVPASSINQWLISNDFPPGFRLLCFNCNHKVHQAYREAGVPPMSLGTIQREISKWANLNFPNRDAVSVRNKLSQEIEEWARNPDDASEFADVMILILDWAQLKGVNVQDAINRKMGINVTRNWVFDPTGRTWQHEIA